MDGAIVLKSKCLGNDSYCAVLGEKYKTLLVHPINTTIIEAKVDFDPSRYQGIVFTSPNAVLAFGALVQEKQMKDLLDINVFVSGEKTRRASYSLGFRKVTISARNDAESLCEVFPVNNDRLLYVCGEMRLDTISSYFTSVGIQFDELIVYRTEIVDIRNELRNTLGTLEHSRLIWILLFSPSGVKSLTECKPILESYEPRLRFAAIGRTTQTSAIHHGFKVHCVANSPDPKGFLESMEGYNSNH